MLNNLSFQHKGDRKYTKLITKITNIYSEERMKVIRSHIMKQNADLQEGISQA